MKEKIIHNKRVKLLIITLLITISIPVVLMEAIKKSSRSFLHTLGFELRTMLKFIQIDSKLITKSKT